MYAQLYSELSGVKGIFKTKKKYRQKEFHRIKPDCR